MKRNYMIRMLLSYLPILFFTVCVFIFIFVAILNDLAVRNALQANKITTGLIANMVDNTLKHIDLDVIREIQTNGDLENFFRNVNDPDPRIVEFMASDVMSRMIARHDFISSVYLYRAFDRMVMDQSTIQTLSEFYDRSYLEETIQPLFYKRWSAPREIEDLTGLRSLESVVTLSRKVPVDSGSLGLIVINVKVSSIRKMVDQMIDRDITESDIYDAQSGSFFQEGKRMDSDSSTFSYYQSNYTGWTYSTAIIGGKYFGFLFKGSLGWAFLALAAMMLATGLTLHVTRQNYKPVEAILRRIDTFSGQMKQSELLKNRDEFKNKSEFMFIDQAIENLITNNMEFKEKHQENLLIRRQQFLKSILSDDFELDHVQWEQEWQDFDLIDGHYLVVVLEIDRFVDFTLKYTLRDQSLFKFIISSVVSEIAALRVHRAVAEWIAKNQLVILLYADSSNDLAFHALHLADQMRQWIGQHLDFTVTFGLGTVTDQASGISKSYDDAAEALRHKVTYGVNMIIDSVEVKKDTDGELFRYLQTIRSAVRHIRMIEPDWATETSRLFADIALNRLQKDEVNRLLHYYIFHLDREMEGANKELSRLWKQEGKVNLLGALDRLDTLEELQSQFEETLSSLVEQMQETAEHRSQFILLREIRDYIYANFTNPDLSLSMLSDRFHVNPKYLSQLFKEELGENFSDFLVSLRIEHAKNRLVETEDTIQEICLVIGYTNPISFGRTFKKAVGISPGHYREEMRNR